MAPARAMSGVAEILLPLALDQTYSYAVPADLELAAGDVVVVPLGNRRSVGVVWALTSGSGGNLKQIEGKVDAPSMAAPLRKLVEWLAWYTLAPKGSALALGLRVVDASPETARIGVRLAGPPPARMTPARTRVIEAAAGGLVHARRDLARAAGVGVGVIDGLVAEGTLAAIELKPEPVAGTPDPAYIAPALSGRQGAAAEVLAAAVATAAHGGSGGSAEPPPVILIDGVTGSGKTEVYFEAVAEAIRRGRQTLILMPEIALTSVFLDRFAARFGVRPSAWHSGISGRRRERLFGAVAAGEVVVVAGARSSLFLPFRDLGLIVVDEEHEGAYKQEDGVCYHTRDMAIVRGRFEHAPVLLASATPSIETRVNVSRGRFKRVALPERFGGRTLPDIQAIDLRADPPEPGRWIAPRLVEEVTRTLAAGDQSLLFLNRRGYAPLTLCRSCGHRFTCTSCSAWLVEHRFKRALVCHHCGHSERIPPACPACGSDDELVACGPGVERIAEEVAALFPDARRIVLSSDFPGGTERLRAELDAVSRGEADIVIGTQLVAKGHNFPHMTMVGVLDADIGLTSGDPRAAERTFQLLQQVTGRAGRGAKPGRAFVQTYQPDHPVLAALVSGEAERFYREETTAREAAGMPPFGRLAALIVSAAKREEAEAHARELARLSEPSTGIMVLGPAEAPLAMIRGRYRFRLLVKTSRDVNLQDYLRAWIIRGPKPRGSVRVHIDVDPQSFL
jgi:primosomal protein N' (replication factor Y)